MKGKAYRLLVVGLIGGVMLLGGVPTAHAATVSERLTRLEKRVKALRASDASQNTSIRSLKSRVYSLESSRRTMTARIVVLESSNTTMMARIATLEAENASLTATVSSLEATTSEIETRVCEVEASVEDLAVHDHDTAYAPVVHNHDASYSAIAHNHNASYSTLGHDHGSTYSLSSHAHANYAPVAHGHALADVSGAESRFSSAESRITSIENAPVYKLNSFVSVDTNTINGLAGPHVIFTGANFHIRNGTGNTFTTTGKGNLIVGYNETSSDTRTGSHNVAIGPYHTYTSFGGLIAGQDNNAVAPSVSVTGGFGNTASNQFSSVTGGFGNTANGQYATVTGGAGNVASGSQSSVSGGGSRTATGTVDWRAGSLFEDF